MSVPSTALLAAPVHQSQLAPADNKFHVGNGDDGKHYWLTPPDLYASLNAEFGPFDFDPCPWPKPEGFDGLTCEWGQRNYVNPPFGSIMHNGRKKGPTAWMRKAIEEQRKGKLSVVVYPVDKWVLMMLAATGAVNVRNLGDVRWHATEDGTIGKGTGRHIAAFILYPANPGLSGGRPSAEADGSQSGARLFGVWVGIEAVRLLALVWPPVLVCRHEARAMVYFCWAGRYAYYDGASVTRGRCARP